MNLKLIALLPSAEISATVRGEQQYIADEFGPKHALRTPPHITIIPPIQLDGTEEKQLWKIAGAVALESKSFQIKLNGYGTFRQGVVFINMSVPEELTALYKSWRKQLMASMPHVLNKYPDRPYHPHLTLAHRDVTPQQFKEMWKYYADRKYKSTFEVNSFWVLKHVGKGWEKEKEFRISYFVITYFFYTVLPLHTVHGSPVQANRF